MDPGNMFERNTVEGLGQIAGNHVVGCQGTTHAAERPIKLVNHKLRVVEDEGTGGPQVMKEAKADDKGFIFGLIIGAVKIQLKRKIPTIVIGRLNDNPNIGRG
ncbi:hypothetical protein ACFX1R_025799 [Malus domestica]